MPAKIDPRYKNVAAVGAGSIGQQEARPTPTLDGVSEYQYVTIANILPIKFIGRVAQSRPVPNAPVRIVDGAAKGVDENTLKAAGLDLRNPDHAMNSSLEHVSIEVPIEAGQSINLRGDEAQVIVRQLVNEILAFEGKTVRQGSPAYRKEVEGRIIQGIRNIDELIGSVPSKDQLIDTALKEENEKAFPDLNKDK